MDRVEKIKELTDKKIKGVKEGNTKIVFSINRDLSGILNEWVRRIKRIIGEKNIYKDYVITNKELIKDKLSINTEVSTVKEANALIKMLDFRHLFGLVYIELDEVFVCGFLNMEKTTSFAFNSEKEADEAVKSELLKHNGKEISISGYKRFGMHVREIVIKEVDTEAWISYSSSRNKYLLMIGNKSKDSYLVTVALDILDLYQAFMTCHMPKAEQELCELLGIRIKYIVELSSKYLYNLKMIENNIDKNKFPALSELIGEHIPKLKVILGEAIEKLYYHKDNEDNWVFSSSMEYLSKKMGKAKSTVNQIVNTLALIGLLAKADVDTVEYEKGDSNEITYFYIPQYSEVLFEEAEQLAKIMLYSGKRITASAFTRKTCIEKFGEERVNMIFKDKVSKARAN